jgi:hypothetical protein
LCPANVHTENSIQEPCEETNLANAGGLAQNLARKNNICLDELLGSEKFETIVPASKMLLHRARVAFHS